MWQKRISIAVIGLMTLVVVSFLVPLIRHQRDAARRIQSQNNLKQIGLGLSNYADTFRGFPPGGVFNVQRRGFHGWMTLILPYLDDSPFYNSVNLNEPWDSTQNAGLFLNAIPCYENPGEPTVHRNWEFPVTHYSANSHLMAVNSFVALNAVENKAQVFLVGELGGAFLPWGCPYNWRELDSLNSRPPMYGRSTRDGCHFVFVDGRVAFVANDTSKEVLNRMTGDDLSGSKANDIQMPSAFPCPTDTVKRDIHGHVKSP